MKDVEFADLQHCILLRDRLVTKVETRATLCFNLQCNDVARQVEEKCYSYYRTLIPPTINSKIKLSNDFKYVNKIKSPDKNIPLQHLIVCSTIPSFLFDKNVKTKN